MAIVDPEWIANIIMHVTLIALLIGAFYFTYIPVVEKSVVKREVSDVMDSIANDIHTVIPKDDLAFLKPLVEKYVKAPDMRKQDEEAAAHNRSLMFNAAKYLGILTAVSVAAIFGLWYFFDVDMGHLFVTNGILLVVVAVTYFVFTTLVIKNYRSADPNFVKLALVKTMKKFTSS